MTSSKKQLDSNAEDGFRRQSTLKFSTYLEEEDDHIYLLEDFVVNSKLDRDLLLGIFEDHSELQKAV